MSGRVEKKLYQRGRGRLLDLLRLSCLSLFVAEIAKGSSGNSRNKMLSVKCGNVMVCVFKIRATMSESVNVIG